MLTPEKLAEYVRGYDRIKAARWPMLEAAAERARALVPLLAARCRERGATRVRLFGSLVTQNFGATPDVDLAVDGLDMERCFFLGEELGLLASPIGVDLVDVGSACQTLVDVIERDGIDV